MTRPAISKMFVKIGLARDFETAATMLDNRLIIEDKFIPFYDLSRCFVRVFFKESLISKLQEI